MRKPSVANYQPLACRHERPSQRRKTPWRLQVLASLMVAGLPLCWPHHVLAAEQTLGPVTVRDTLWSLARTARGDAPYSLYQAMVALLQKKPQAFLNHNIHHVRQGARLVLPSAAEIAAIDPVQAEQRVEADAILFQQYLAKRQKSDGHRQRRAKPLVAARKTSVNAVHSCCVKSMSVMPKAKPVMANTPGTQAANKKQMTAKPQLQAKVFATPAGSLERHLTATKPENTANFWQQARLDSTLGLAWRYFPHHGLQDQNQHAVSTDLLLEWSWRSLDDRHSVQISPYGRWDGQDSARHLVDLRQAYYAYLGEGFEVKAGIDHIFWGVTESLHLVDIINQTDWLATPEGEAKLGQPMLQVNLQRDWGSIQAFLLPYFRPRQFAGLDGRFRLPVNVANDELYQSSQQQHSLDYAIRYQQQFDALDVAISYFAGTSREPILNWSSPTGALQPYYPQIRQWGLESQYIIDSWIWKLEAIHRQSTGLNYTAAVSGFEYSQVGVLDSAVDLGWLLEYQYDSRGPMANVVAQRDLFVGWRVALNDTAGSEVLIGLVQDLQNSNTRHGKLEASMRFSNNLRLSLNAWFFQTQSMLQPTWWYRKDDYIELGLNYYF